jgi:cysteinyl-tRNA synthetase
VHVEHLLVDEEKMSKSLGNVFNVPDIIAKGYRPSALRYLMLSTHYRKQLKFSWDTLDQAEESLRRLSDFIERLDRVSVQGTHTDVTSKVAVTESQFAAALEQDLNTAGALGTMFDLVRALNAAIDTGGLGTGDVPAVKGAFDRFDQVLGVLSLRRHEDQQASLPVEEIERLMGARQDARKRRDFAEGDRIRQELLTKGIVLEDLPTGTRWKRK